jgi:tRNA(Ile)-lysidine synthetase-like protein
MADPVAVRIPGDCLAPDRATRIHFELAEQAAAPSCDTLKAELWWKKIPDPVEVRGWRPGDCYRPVGEARDHKLKDMFQQLRIPSWKRAGWPIVTSGGKILWTRDFGPAAELAAGVAGGDGPVLRIWEGGAGPF